MDIAQVTHEAFDARFPEGSWDAALYPPFAHPIRYFASRLRETGDGEPGEIPDFGYENPELEEMARLFQSSFDPDLGVSLNRRFWEILREDFPITGLISLVAVDVVHSRLRGPDDLFDDPGEMWIDEDWGGT